VALRYGPLIYSAESVDQNLNNVLSPTSALTAKWMDDLLRGVMAIEGTWADGSAFRAIPNYARDNRGTGAVEDGQDGPGRRGRGRRTLSSSVWLKDQ
ncbi:MAG: hypothetical protein GXX98_05415, partial [Planctomycetes bacterium]|nr:hypothetical protein [Planctomycetota bacterium]